MKINNILLIVLILFNHKVIGQYYSSGDTLAAVAINAKTSSNYNHFDKVRFVLTKKKLPGIPAGGTNIYAYVKNDTVNRIVIIAMTRHGQLAKEYFFDKNLLIYVYQSFEYFMEETKHGSWKNFKGIYGWESRLYFEGEKLKFQTISGPGNLVSDSEWKSILKESSEIMKFIIKQTG